MYGRILIPWLSDLDTTAQTQNDTSSVGWQRSQSRLFWLHFCTVGKSEDATSKLYTSMSWIIKCSCIYSCLIFLPGHQNINKSVSVIKITFDWVHVRHLFRTLFQVINGNKRKSVAATASASLTGRFRKEVHTSWVAGGQAGESVKQNIKHDVSPDSVGWLFLGLRELLDSRNRR